MECTRNTFSKNSNNWLVVDALICIQNCIVLNGDRPAGSQMSVQRVHNIIIGNINSAFHGLDLAAIHGTGDMASPFLSCNLELRGGETFL